MKSQTAKLRSVLATSVLALTISSIFSSTASAAPTFVNLQILLEGAAHNSPYMMRTDLWNLGLLDTITTPQNPQTPCRDGVSEQINLSSAPSAQTTPVDWVCVELRDAITPTTVRARFVGIVQANGVIVRSDGSIPIIPLNHSSQYYVVVTHKSHLPVASELKSIDNSKLEVIFRSESTGSFGGTHQASVGGGWAMLTGNPNQDDNLLIRDINGSDIITWSQSNSVSGQYLSADVNLDGDVNGADKALIVNNNGLHSNIPFNQ